MKNDKSQKVSTASDAPAGSASLTEKPLSFEASMERLDLLVDEMEKEKLPLQVLLQRYEEGIKLARDCQKQLDAAEQKVRQISESASGEMEWVEFSERPDKAE